VSSTDPLSASVATPIPEAAVTCSTLLSPAEQT
jgi:hypothetical protein